MPIRHTLRTAVIICTLGLGACATGDDGADVVVPTDTQMRFDARTDTRSSDTGNDTGTAAHDTGNATDVPIARDVPVAVDTGNPIYCPDTCTNDSQCQSGCPTPSPGYRYCCQYGAGGGSCSQTTSACSGASGGVLGSACTMDSDCNMGGANCCLMVGSAGTCGCHGSFGCNPAPLCP